jgi:hypothetical protein
VIQPQSAVHLFFIGWLRLVDCYCFEVRGVLAPPPLLLLLLLLR